MTAICADNIILVGFPGTGKTLVGKQVAEELGWVLVDMDMELEVQAGKSIPRIFSEDGEAAFRVMEKELLREICLGNERVISTGGGVVLDQENRDLMLTKGFVICLDALPETIHQRLRGESGTLEPERPLLSGPDSLERIQRGKAGREGHYAVAHHTIATDSLTVEQVASQVVAAWTKMAACKS